MKYMLKSEQLLMFAASIYGMTWLDLSISWWLYPILFFVPDLGLTGYAVNAQIGAITYNTLHHKGIAAAIFVVGILVGNSYLMLGGLLMFGHASFDRIFGYGLKYPDHFSHTHLGTIGGGP